MFAFVPLEQRAMTLLRGAIQGVFFLPCKVACLHGVVTLFSFTVLQVEFPFFAAFVVSYLYACDGLRVSTIPTMFWCGRVLTDAVRTVVTLYR